MKSMLVTGSTSFTAHHPTRMPLALAKMVSAGIMMSAASTRGTTRCDEGARPALERIDLLRHAHRAQLGGIPRADAAGQHQRGEHRASSRMIDETTRVPTT